MTTCCTTPPLKTFREKADAAVAAAVAEGAPADLKGPALIASQTAHVMTVALIAGIQDAIAVGDQYPNNRFNADMQKHPLFGLVCLRRHLCEGNPSLQAHPLSANNIAPRGLCWQRKFHVSGAAWCCGREVCSNLNRT